MNPQNRLLV